MASLHLNNHSLVTSLAVEIVNSKIKNMLTPLLQKNNALGVMLDLQDVFQRFSFDSIYRFSFGLDPDCLTRQSGFTPVFVENFDLTLKLFAERATTGSPFVWKLKRLLNLGSRKQLKKAVRVINVLARDVIQQRCKKGFSINKDLLSRFMNTDNELPSGDKVESGTKVTYHPYAMGRLEEI
ncbi:hypothetical protein JHK85_027770 [Glycine max]|nr:hypothetical protein JHK85_027770 [Glycine max]